MMHNIGFDTEYWIMGDLQKHWFRSIWRSKYTELVTNTTEHVCQKGRDGCVVTSTQYDTESWRCTVLTLYESALALHLGCCWLFWHHSALHFIYVKRNRMKNPGVAAIILSYKWYPPASHNKPGFLHNESKSVSHRLCLAVILFWHIAKVDTQTNMLFTYS